MKLTIKVPRKWERRKKTKFALLPISIKHGDHREIRWLERVTVEQEYFGGMWWNEKFIDERS